MDCKDVPKEIKYSSLIVDVAAHPNKDVIAFADIDGDIFVNAYACGKPCSNLLSSAHHKKACRALSFSLDGEKLFSTAKDLTIQALDLNTGTNSMKLNDAHSESPYSLLVLDDNIIASGDDSGCIKIWDLRFEKVVMEAKDCEEFISCMVHSDRTLVATSGEGTVTSYDIRKHKMTLQSELFDSELLSVAKIKNDSKLIVGDSDGVLNIFNWGQVGNISDRFPGHPSAIDSIVAINDDVICTGCADGKIRLVSVLPNRFVGVVGEHESFPVENLALSHCGQLLISCSHDQRVCFWDVRDAKRCTRKANKRKKAKRGNKDKPITCGPADSGANNFFADLAVPAPEGDKAVSSDDNLNDSDSSDDS